MSEVVDEPLTVGELQIALAAMPTGVEANALADKIRKHFGAGKLIKGPDPLVDETAVAWAIEALGANGAVRVVSANGQFTQELQQIGASGVYAGVATLPDKTAFVWNYEIAGKPIGGGNLEVYKVSPDSKPQAGVPRGTLVKQSVWKSSIFPDTTRDWWIYTPAQYDPATPACVMIFQDGMFYTEHVPVVFDNLIAQGDMPVTVAIFVNAGMDPDGSQNRSFEYDTLSDQYARFIIEELLPEAEKTVSLRHDPESRAIAGTSSGGICAWTVAWERPDQFSKVLSWVGSFTNIACGPDELSGGHNYPFLIRRHDRKPIRVFLQGGENDLDRLEGNWPLGNLAMAKALAFKDYDYHLEYGQGFHSFNHGRAILPESLRWLWRGYLGT